MDYIGTLNKLPPLSPTARLQKWSIIACTILIFIASCSPVPDGRYKSWEVYGGNTSSNHYSSLTEVDTNTVKDLQVAWTYHTGDAEASSEIQVNPVIVDGILYGISPRLKLFAVDAATGQEKWSFDPADTTLESNRNRGYFSVNTCRGLAFYRGKGEDNRILYTVASQLYCIDAASGKPLSSFGDNGATDLHKDLDRDLQNAYLVVSTPGIVYKDLIIIGSRVSEEYDAAPGHIRAYDVHTGKLRWIFHTIPFPGEDGYDTWDDKEAYKHIGGANVWSGFSLDEKKGIVFAPTGSASYDFYGARRTGDNLFANCVLALNAETGKRIWHFQTVHHDVWDSDLPTAPVLVNVIKDGKEIEAVAQVTKNGLIFLLERKTGKPVYPVEERAVPSASGLPGEILSPTQPFPSFFEPFVRHVLQEKDLNTYLPDSSYADIRKRFLSYASPAMFSPPSQQGTVVFPGFSGGAEWGGPSFDPETGILYINANEIPWILTMVERKEKEHTARQTYADAGRSIYRNTCMGCHGPELKGGGNYPSLVGVNKKYTEEEFKLLVNNGRRMMPAFKQLSEQEKTALAAFVLHKDSIANKPYTEEATAKVLPEKLPFGSTGYNKFLSKEGYPAVAPPWGTITAVNLNTGKTVWKNIIGDYPEMKAKGIHSGTENYGGSVVTAGGLVFIAATRDKKFRAFNKRTGELLWETTLPASGFATPSVYEVDGRQYIALACGGGRTIAGAKDNLPSNSSDIYLAFSLPGKKK